MHSSEELWNIAKHLAIPNFVGVFPLNKLPTSIKAPSNFIVNTHTHNLPGEHWIAVSYKNGGIVFAFDPLGAYYPYLLRKFIHDRLKPYGGVHYNTEQIQDFDEQSCGIYCIAWLIYINTDNK